MKKVKSSLILLTCFVVLFAGRGQKYEVGDTVADFKLKNVDGKMVSLADYEKEKGVIVIFDCNTCPYSKAYSSRIIALNDKYTALGFPVVAINANDAEESPGDSFNEMVDVAKRKGYTFPYLVDESQAVARSFGATNTPHVFVLKREGKEYKVAYIGTIDDNPRDASDVSKKYVEQAVDALIAGKKIETQKTRAVGCGIKWKNT